MGWPHYPYVEGVYDKLNLLWYIGTGGDGTGPVDLAYPSRTNYQKVSLFADAQGSVERQVGRAGGAHPPWKIFQNYNGASAFDAVTWAYIVANAPLPQGDWTRKYYREVTDNSSTTEFYGGLAVANGQRAYRRSDRQIVDRVSGAWVPNTTASKPDVITTGGNFQGGDIIGDWLFTEIEAAIALLGTLGFIVHWADDTTDNDKGFTASDAALATAKSLAEAGYDGATPSTAITLYPLASNTLTQNSGPGDYNATLTARENVAVISLLSLLAPATVYWYQIAQAIVLFSDQGDAVLEGVLKTWDNTVAVSGAARSAVLGAIASKPNNPWAAGTPTPSTDYTTGWRGADFPLALVKFTI